MSFVLATWQYSYPSGGLDMVYHLASKFAENGARTAIIRLTDHDRFMYARTNDETFRKSFAITIKRKLAASKFTRPLISSYFRYLRRVDYDFSLLKNVKMIRSDDPKAAPPSEKIIAGGWPAAYFVNEYVQSHSAEGYHFIQHAEDEIYSGISKYISASFDFPLRKIVTNTHVLERFRKDNPMVFGVGADTNFFHLKEPLEKKDPKAILVQLRAAESKGAIYALKALEILHEQGSTLNISAFGDLKPKALPSYVEYSRYPTRKKLLELYNASSIFILPSLLEGFSIPTIEAMACGSAVVVTDNGGVNEYVRNGVNGIMVPTRNPDAIVQAVQELVNDRELRRSMAAEGQKTALDYDVNRQCERNIKTFRQETQPAS